MYKPIGGYFDDIDGHWAQAHIEKLAEEGIAKGTGSGKFNPNNLMTRAEMSVFLARALGFRPTLEKGLAYTHGGEGPNDVEILNCSWYYGWGPGGDLSDKRYVPMYRGGSNDPWLTLPKDYSSYILLFNEPNNREPYGCSRLPAVAAAMYKEALAYHTKAAFVVGGVSSWCLTWLEQFMDECTKSGIPIPTCWHAHGYEAVDYVIDKWRKLHQLTGGEYWITEFAAPYSGQVEDVRGMIEFIQQTGWIKRCAYFTNRLSGTEPWCPPNWEKTVPLIDWNTGQLTEIGEYYVD
jgi:hypothetical protein